MNVFGHDDKRVQFISAFAAVAVDRAQKKTDVSFDDEEFPAMVNLESYEICSGWGAESRLQSETSAAGSRAYFDSLSWHERNSCPSRLFFAQRLSFWERVNG
jgi:hypothetical protein